MPVSILCRIATLVKLFNRTSLKILLGKGPVKLFNKYRDVLAKQSAKLSQKGGTLNLITNPKESRRACPLVLPKQLQRANKVEPWVLKGFGIGNTLRQLTLENEIQSQQSSLGESGHLRLRIIIYCFRVSISTSKILSETRSQKFNCNWVSIIGHKARTSLNKKTCKKIEKTFQFAWRNCDPMQY